MKNKIPCPAFPIPISYSLETLLFNFYLFLLLFIFPSNMRLWMFSNFAAFMLSIDF